MASKFTRPASSTGRDYGGKKVGKHEKMLSTSHVKWGVDESPRKRPDLMEKAGKALRAGRLG
jgi:hypothetical protein